MKNQQIMKIIARIISGLLDVRYAIDRIGL